jgi:hypothetical protein
MGARPGQEFVSPHHPRMVRKVLGRETRTFQEIIPMLIQRLVEKMPSRQPALLLEEARPEFSSFLDIWPGCRPVEALPQVRQVGLRPETRLREPARLWEPRL